MFLPVLTLLSSLSVSSECNSSAKLKSTEVIGAYLSTENFT